MIIDLSHFIEEGMPVYPGTESPTIKIAADYEYGYRENRIQILTHVGTHLDCPAHMFPNGISVTDMAVSQFYGAGIVIDCSGIGGRKTIDADFLNTYMNDFIRRDFLLFYTGWDKSWGSPEYFEAYPTFTEEAVTILARMGIKGIGVDAVSIDPVGSDYNNHKILLQSGKIIIENLHALDQLIGKEFNFACFPLKIRGGDGSPIRAVGFLE